MRSLYSIVGSDKQSKKGVASETSSHTHGSKTATIAIPDEKPSDEVIERLFAELILPEVPVDRQGECVLLGIKSNNR